LLVAWLCLSWPEPWPATFSYCSIGFYRELQQLPPKDREKENPNDLTLGSKAPRSLCLPFPVCIGLGGCESELNICVPGGDRQSSRKIFKCNK
jgi:hypothetical protein